MPIPSDACAGPCSKLARELHATYDQALDTWRHTAYTAAGGHGEPPVDWHLLDEEAEQLGLEPRPAPPGKTFRLGAPIFCGGCLASVRRALGEVDRLAFELAQWSDGHRGAASGERIGRRVSGPRSVSPIIELLDQLYGEVTDVEDEWRAYRKYLPVRRTSARGSHNRSSAIAFIGEQLDGILAFSEYTEFGHRVLKWERVLLAQTKSDPVTRRRPGRCPRCQLVSVLVTEDDGITKCQNVKCGRWLNEEEYQAEVVHGADSAVAEDTRQARAAR